MKPFLRQIAEAYLDHEPQAMIDYCFVVTNKRAATFLSRHFAELADERKTAIMQPHITTISDLVSDNTPWIEASRMELLFILYNVYRDVVTGGYGDLTSLSADQRERLTESIDFDRFQYWGEVLISDFNDVDKYLVDAAELFKNVEALKEISSNHLTEEQMDIISRYWSGDKLPEQTDRFWKHTGGGELSSKFVKLWQVLYPVYTRFRETLTLMGKCYGGMAMRRLVDDIKANRGANMPHRRYVFVGFNILSTAEHRIFELLQSAGMADFYWDYQSPTFTNQGNRATRFLQRYVEEFKSRYPVATETLTGFPSIEIISVPSTIGQAKVVGDVLKKLYPTVTSAPFNRESHPDKPATMSSLETAIILPDEKLAIPMLHAMPRTITTANVTMGYPLKLTPVASLVKAVISMQIRARKMHDQYTFFYEDVNTILTHPLIIRRHGRLSLELLNHITRNNLFNITFELLNQPRWLPLKPIFEVVSNLDDPDAVIDYLDKLLDFVGDTISVPEPDDDRIVSQSLQNAFVQRYRDALRTLRTLSSTYLKGRGIVMADRTVFHLAERLVTGETVPLEGMPLEGLQIMGVLEARALDFDNIIMPSMNERIFPRKHYQRSFIPNALRRGYGMATLDHQESIFAYYFYRLITRAKKVFLLYDGRSSGSRNGQCSRYISQLEYLFDIPDLKRYVTAHNYDSIIGDEIISIERDNRLREIIKSYLPEAENPKYLSASAINKLIDCPLKFCLSELEGLGEPDTVKDYIDEGMLGSIVHSVFETMYNEIKGDRPKVHITAEMLRELKNKPLVIQKYIRHAINEHYRHLGRGNDSALSADTQILAEVIGRMVTALLDKEPVPFDYIASEWRRHGVLNVSDTLSVNFTLSIDRIDSVNIGGVDTLRVVDYKTGSDKPLMSDWAAAFDPDNEKRPKVMVQLFLYCNAYAQMCDNRPYTGPIKPQMYNLRTIVKENIVDCKIAKTADTDKRASYDIITDYRDYNGLFLNKLEERLSWLLYSDEPFRAAKTDHPCKYCQFISICKR